MNAAVVLLAAELAAGAHARFESRYLRRTDAAPAPYDDQVLGGLGIRGNVGHEVVQYAIGLDFFGGATHPAAFAYAVHLRPIGVAFVDGAGFRLSSTLGIGFDGATALLDPATRMPLDVWLEVPIAEGVKIEVAAELAWLPADATRPREDSLSVRWRFDRLYEKQYRIRSANGIYVGFELADRHDATFIGASFGYSLDGHGSF